uniref:BTB domain-containing protein n=1 Tax=Romanomermis culicivorax TaxID=13658 RepID=A0A915JA97_ROMCU
MFRRETSSDAVLLVENDKIIKAHKCILLATCPAFRSLFNLQNTVDLKEFREADVKFLMKFLYGGLVDVPDDVDVWRLCTLSDLLQLETLKKVLHLHIRAKFCHYFHKPCPSCSTNILEFCIPNLGKFSFFNDLYAKCLRWQAKYFLRIWKMKSFAALNAENLAICQKSLHQMI